MKGRANPVRTKAMGGPARWRGGSFSVKHCQSTAWKAGGRVRAEGAGTAGRAKTRQNGKFCRSSGDPSCRVDIWRLPGVTCGERLPRSAATGVPPDGSAGRATLRRCENSLSAPEAPNLSHPAHKSRRSPDQHRGAFPDAAYSSSPSFPGPFSLLRRVRTLMPRSSAALVRLLSAAWRACWMRTRSASATLSELRAMPPGVPA